jgi:hypothetical protein
MLIATPYVLAIAANVSPLPRRLIASATQNATLRAGDEAACPGLSQAVSSAPRSQS